MSQRYELWLPHVESNRIPAVMYDALIATSGKTREQLNWGSEAATRNGVKGTVLVAIDPLAPDNAA